MSALQQYYDQNPIGVVDRNLWDARHAEVALRFRTQAVYTPLIQWTDEPSRTGASTTISTELMEGDINTDEIPFTANYIDATAIDSRSRKYRTGRHADKVQIHESSNIFQMWHMSGGSSASRDWKPLLRGVLGNNLIRKFERLARNAYLLGPKDFWTYAGGASSFGTLDGTKVFSLEIVNEWNLRLGSTGSPIVPGNADGIKVALVPPGSLYDFMKSLGGASANEASMWRDAQLYAGDKLNYELGLYKNCRFVQVPNNKYGLNDAVLYNTGTIAKQFGVTEIINAGDGAPDPETDDPVDGVYYVGQKNVKHYLQLENFAPGDFAKNQIVTVHIKRIASAATAGYGVDNGVDPLDGMAFERRIIAVDDVNNRLVFDRPIMRTYNVPMVQTPASGAAGTYYAFVTRAKHIGMVLALGSKGGILGAVARNVQFKEPKPVDDFESVWRFVYDSYHGYNIWEPNLFEIHLCNVTLPSPGGKIAP